MRRKVICFRKINAENMYIKISVLELLIQMTIVTLLGGTYLPLKIWLVTQNGIPRKVHINSETNLRGSLPPGILGKSHVRKALRAANRPFALCKSHPECSVVGRKRSFVHSFNK